VRIALLSDVHGNLTGLRAVLARLDDLGGADLLVAAGDHLVGGAGAGEVLDLLVERGARLLRGNLDETLTDPAAALERTPAQWRDYSERAHAWFRERLSAAHWALLRALPLSAVVEPAPGRRLFVCHAAPTDTWANVCAADAPTAELRRAFGPVDAEVVAYGHYHAHHVLALDGKLLVNVASVGLRADGLAALTLVDFADGRWGVRQFQVAYDVAEEARLTAEHGVPQP
jgi:predicted phosphodiesterase